MKSVCKTILRTLTSGSVIIKHRPGCSSVAGRSKNKTNEDRYTMLDLTPNTKYFAVFDGHNGSFVSEFLRRRLSEIVRCKLNMASFDGNVFGVNETLLSESFADCQREVKDALLKMSDCTRKEIVGSTAVVALLTDYKYLSIANVGDSKVIACDHGKPIELSTEHNPSNPIESERIEKRGGWIDWDSRFKPLVNGRLSMTRSFGNLLLRSVGVTSRPKIAHRVVESDDFLLLCSDGLSHTITDRELSFIVAQHDNATEACLDLTTTAQQYGSEDDVTALVIPLAGWGTGTSDEGKYSMFRTMIGARADG